MFRFTIRDVLWLTALVAMGVAWWLDQSRLSLERSRLAEDRMHMQSEFDDKMAILDQMQRETSARLMRHVQRFGP